MKYIQMYSSIINVVLNLLVTESVVNILFIVGTATIMAATPNLRCFYLMELVAYNKVCYS